jgi:hypothetical protein
VRDAHAKSGHRIHVYVKPDYVFVHLTGAQKLQLTAVKVCCKQYQIKKIVEHIKPGTDLAVPNPYGICRISKDRACA